MKTFKLYCLSASLLTALLMAISVFLAEVGKTEYKSQIRKRKLKTAEKVIVDETELQVTSQPCETEIAFGRDQFDEDLTTTVSE